MASADPREALRQAIAAEHRLFVEAERHDRLADRWRLRAELAVRRGEEGLARQALERSAAEERFAALYRAQAAVQTDAIRRVKRRLSQPAVTTSVPVDKRLDRLSLDDRLERDLQELKGRLAAQSC